MATNNGQAGGEPEVEIGFFAKSLPRKVSPAKPGHTPPRPVSSIVILSSIICCLPLGCIARQYKTKGKDAYVVGNHMLGDSYTVRSRVLAWSGIVVGVILAVIFIAAISGLIYWQETM